MNKHNKYQPWKLEWESEHVRRFWNWRFSNPEFEANTFSKMVGDDLINQVKAEIPLEGLVLDLGAARGHLTEKLVRHGIDIVAIDSSDVSAIHLAKKLKRTNNFLGSIVGDSSKIPLKNNSVSVVFFIETVEHLTNEILNPLIYDIFRIIDIGKYIVVTTPNDENLAVSNTICPNCGCVFHTVQHVQSFSQEKLMGLFETIGFKTLICKPTVLSHYPKMLRRAHRLRLKFRKQKYPHLIYIGMKSKNSK